MEPEVDSIFELVERSYIEIGREPVTISSKVGGDMSLRGKNLSNTLDALDTLFTNKLELGSTPYLMFKRVDECGYYDVIVRLCRIYGWYLELTNPDHEIHASHQ